MHPLHSVERAEASVDRPVVHFVPLPARDHHRARSTAALATSQLRPGQSLLCKAHETVFQPGSKYAEDQHLSLPQTALGRGRTQPRACKKASQRPDRATAQPCQAATDPAASLAVPWPGDYQQEVSTPPPAAPRPRAPAHRAGRPAASAPPGPGAGGAACR